MNYLKQINGFWIWRKLNSISHVQTDLYFAILDCANTAQWRKKFSIPNSTLMNLCQLSKTQLHNTRNQLIQLGLIGYEPGKRGHSGMYEIIPLYNTEYDTSFGTNSETKTGTDERNTNKENINKKKDKTETQKKNYRKNVFLTDDEYLSLQESYGINKLSKILDKLDCYKAETGKIYKSDYAAIRRWVAGSIDDAPLKKGSDSFRDYDVFHDNYDHEALERLTRLRH